MTELRLERVVRRQVREFVRSLFPGRCLLMVKESLPAGGLRAVLYSMPNEVALVADQTTRALERMRSVPGTHIYFGVHARFVGWPDDGDAVEFVRVLVLDIDDKPSKPNATEALLGKLKLLEQHRIRPTFVVRSGSGDGRHLYFVLDRRWPARSTPNRVRALKYRLGSWLESDIIYDGYRLMRWPWSCNWKSGVAMPLSFEIFKPGRKVSLEAVEAALDALGVPMPKLPTKVTGVRASSAACATRSSKSPRRAKGSVVSTAPPNVDFLEPELRALVDTGWIPGCGFESPSHLDLRVAALLLRAGLSDNEVLAVFIHNGIGRIDSKGLDYYERTFAAAKEPAAGVERYGAVIERSKADLNRDWLRLRLLDGQHEDSVVDARVYRDNAKYAQWMTELLAAVGEARSSNRGVEDLRGRRLAVEVTSRQDGFIELKHFLPPGLAQHQQFNPHHKEST